MAESSRFAFPIDDTSEEQLRLTRIPHVTEVVGPSIVIVAIDRGPS